MTVIKHRMDDDPAWLRAAWDDLGLKEIPGKKDNPKVVQMYAESGFPYINDDETPWCAAAVGAWLKRAGLKPSGSLMARSYLNWGETTSHPKRGDIVIFSRGKAPSGHVAFYLGEDKNKIYHIGGNQSNAVTVTGSPRTKLLGYRTPVTKKKLEEKPVPALNPIPKTVKTDSKPINAMNLLIDLGWHKHHAAALIGNALVQSNLDTNGSGIMRWGGKRAAHLDKFAQDNGLNRNDLETQVRFIDWELRNTEKNIFHRFKKTNDMEESLRIAMAYVNPVGYNPNKPESGDRWAERLKTSYALL